MSTLESAVETKMSWNCNLTFCAKSTITSALFLRLGHATSSLELVDQVVKSGPLHANFLANYRLVNILVVVSEAFSG